MLFFFKTHDIENSIVTAEARQNVLKLNHQLNLPDIDNAEQRLLIELHVVELKNQMLKALRVFSLPPIINTRFFIGGSRTISAASK